MLFLYYFSLLIQTLAQSCAFTPVVTHRGQLFNGITDFLDLANGSPTLLGPSFSFSATIRRDAPHIEAHVFDFGSGPDQSQIFVATATEPNDLNSVHFGQNLDSCANNNYCWLRLGGDKNIFPIGSQHVYLFTFDSSGTFSIWRDGHLLAREYNLEVPRPVYRRHWYIAKSNRLGDSFFKGLIQDIRIWTTSVPWVCVEQNLRGGGGGIENAIEMPGTKVTDNAGTWPVDFVGVPLLENRAFYFSGSGCGSGLRFPSFNVGSRDFTLSAYIKSTNKYIIPFSTQYGRPGFWQLVWNVNGGLLLYVDDQVFRTTSPSLIVPGEWRFVAVVREGIQFRVYVDSKNVLYFNEAETLNSSPFQVGNTNQQDCNDNDCGDAWISDLRLTIGEVKYQGDTITKPPQTGFTCETGTQGPICRKCRDSRHMQADNQCLSCNPGYMLDHRGHCSNADLPECESRDASARSIHPRCTCNTKVCTNHQFCLYQDNTCLIAPIRACPGTDGENRNGEMRCGCGTTVCQQDTYCYLKENACLTYYYNLCSKTPRSEYCSCGFTTCGPAEDCHEPSGTCYPSGMVYTTTTISTTTTLTTTLKQTTTPKRTTDCQYRDGNGMVPEVCFCGHSTCAQGEYCYAAQSTCTDDPISDCADPMGEKQIFELCQCGGTRCRAGGYCRAAIHKCHPSSAAETECIHTSGDTMSYYACLCGEKTCSSGTYCHKASETCLLSPLTNCRASMGESAATEFCKCGAAYCHEGEFCEAARSVCIEHNINPQCSNHFGQEKEVKSCKCGISTCHPGEYCIKDFSRCMNNPLATCVRSNGLDSTGRFCQCGSSVCEPSQFCYGKSSSCLRYKLEKCNDTNGESKLDNPCACGVTAAKVCNAGQYCYADGENSVCSDQMKTDCEDKDGTKVNAEHCVCGSETCGPGQLCIEERSLCEVPFLKPCEDLEGKSPSFYQCICKDITCAPHQYCVEKTSTCLWAPVDPPSKTRCVESTTCAAGHFCDGGFCERHIPPDSLSFKYFGTPIHLLEFHTRRGDATGSTGGNPQEGIGEYRVYMDMEFYEGLQLRTARLSDFKLYFKEFRTIVPDPYDVPLAGGTHPFLKNGFPQTNFDALVTLQSYENYRLSGRIVDPGYTGSGGGRRHLHGAVNSITITIDFDLDLAFLAERQFQSSEHEESELEMHETEHHFWDIDFQWHLEASTIRRDIFQRNTRTKVGLSICLIFIFFTIVGIMWYIRSKSNILTKSSLDVYHISLDDGHDAIS